MNILKKKLFAILIMSLVILISLVMIAKAPIEQSAVLLFILLAVFTVIDFIVEAKAFTAKQASVGCIIVGITAIAGIWIWGTLAEPETLIYGNTAQSNTLTPAVTDETYDLGLFYFERGDYEEAIQTLKGVANNSTSYVDAQKLLAEAIDQYRSKLIDTASTYVEKADYKLAVDILNAGLLVIPEDEKLLQTIKDYSSAYTNTVRATAISEAEAYAAEQDYANAITTIWDAKDEVGADIELDALQQKYIIEYKDFALIQADKIFNSEGYEAAIQFLKEVQSLPLSDSELSNAIAEYESYRPVSLDNLEIWQHGDLICGPFTDEVVTDNYGNSYHTFYRGNSKSNWGISYSQYNVYKIDKQYTKLSGVFCLKKRWNSIKTDSYLYIYGDDVLLEKYTITGGDEPIEFSVDISGVSLLKIMPDSETVDLEDVSFVANLFLSK